MAKSGGSSFSDWPIIFPREDCGYVIEGFPDWLSVNEVKEAYIRVAVAMSKANKEDLLTTKNHSGYFLRGIIDYSPEGRKANLNLKYAPKTYSYSIAASKLKHLPSAYKDRQNPSLMAEKLHAEHVIPNNMVFSRLVELADSGSSEQELASFLRESCIVVVITKEEAHLLDSVVGLKKDMPEGWTWGDEPRLRLEAAGIKIES